MLAEAHSKQEEHFSLLRNEREGFGYPIYALEHGLNLEQVEQLREALDRDLGKSRGLNKSHWLLWVILAAEVGYAYDGDEYWDSFTRAVPNWQLFGDRVRIRIWFRNFAKEFSGFRPGGRWSEHFSIIAWPIAHAILPRDLQGQFARRLYELRYEFARRHDYSVEQIGEILRAGGSAVSSRFQYFLDQPELAARLVLALRDEDRLDTVSSLHRSTLARIVSDLEHRRSARDWLREARSVLREARFHTSSALDPHSRSSTETSAAAADRLARISQTR